MAITHLLMIQKIRKVCVSQAVPGEVAPFPESLKTIRKPETAILALKAHGRERCVVISIQT